MTLTLPVTKSESKVCKPSDVETIADSTGQRVSGLNTNLGPTHQVTAMYKPVFEYYVFMLRCRYIYNFCRKMDGNVFNLSNHQCFAFVWFQTEQACGYQEPSK